MKIYSKLTKTICIILLVLCLLGGLVSSVVSFLAFICGCYQTSDGLYGEKLFYGDIFRMNTLRYVDYAENWYKNSVNSNLDFNQQDYQNRLENTLSNSSLGLIRVDRNGSTNIAGFKNTNAYMYLTDLIYEDNIKYQVYFNPLSNSKDVFVGLYNGFNNFYPYRYNFLLSLLAFGIVGFISYVFLLASAGKTSTGEVVLKYHHNIPFDVFSFIMLVLFSCSVLAAEEFSVTYYNLYTFNAEMYISIGICLACVALFLILLLVWFHSLVARIRAKQLIKNTVCFKICAWFFKNLLSLLNLSTNKIKSVKKDKSENETQFYEKCQEQLNKQSENIIKKADKVGSSVNNAVKDMDLTLKICLGAIAIIFVNLFLSMIIPENDFAIFLLFAFDGAVFVLCYKYAKQLQKIKDAGERLAKGDFDYKIDVKNLKGEIRNYAENLNAVSDGMTIAVEERLKSERMRYELLTNVSHDIKTPLTSIINYVDLLKTQSYPTKEAQEYIEVLDRQSTKLKKLITDLIEVSKATTGNINVDFQKMELKELISQCVGEYDSRFKEKKLDVQTSLPGEDVFIIADGRLLWRVFDNLLGNIVKYSMPGTRVYINLLDKADTVVITLKNISKDKLNISADELMQRFVRGDKSRTTEGSGLGISIAKSLTEVQKGKFNLQIDGDLFKVEIEFEC